MIFLSLSLLVLLQNHVYSSNELKVSIYYEALCPDSYTFLTHQFCPAYKKIGTLLNVHLVPYGRATHIFKDDKWEFTCQHGPEECRGNKIQACGIAEQKDQQANVDFVCCIMSNYRLVTSTEHLNNCVHYLNTTTESILNCSDTIMGTDLLLSYGNETHSLNRLNFIPTIIFNDDLSKSLKIQDSILHNFYDTAVNYVNPHHTNNSYSVSSHLSVTLLQFLLLFTSKLLMH